MKTVKSVSHGAIDPYCAQPLHDTNKSHRASLFGEKSPYIRYHRAPPAVIGD